MVRKLLFIISLIVFSNILSAQTSLNGKVTEKENGEPVLYGTVAIFKNEVLITGVETDFDGNYSFSNIDPGTYDVEASYVGLQKTRTTGVLVLAGKANKLDIQMVADGVLLDVIEVVEYKVPLIQQDNTTSGGIVTSEQIRNLPTKNINALAATTAGISSIDGGAISVRGSRTNSTEYIIDGIRVSGALVPQSEIDQMQVITGGIQAKYGDVTGGIISITTKGPSNRYSGGIEFETSEGLTPYGYNLLSGNFSGPLLKRKKDKRSILGFRFSGQYIKQDEARPAATGYYRAKESVIRELEANPVVFSNGNLLPAGDFITNEDVDLLDVRPNEGTERLDVTAKIDARLSDNIDISISGAYTDSKNQFGSSSFFNWVNNPFQLSNTYRGNFRFRHRLGKVGLKTDEDKAKKGSLIRNISYILQFGYEKSTANAQDQRHEDRLWNYGYAGNFDINWEPTLGTVNGISQHVGYFENLEGFTPSDINPALAAYNNVDTELPANIRLFNAYNGFRNSTLSSVWGLRGNVGGVYNSFNKSESDRITFQASSNFDIFPGGSNNGRHSIEFGILYEERLSRSYSVAPFGLWTVARLQANAHINGVDTTNIIDTFSVRGDIFDQYAVNFNNDEDLQFYRRVRQLTGQGLDEYVNVDGIDPNLLTLDLFSPLELTDQQLIGYSGYDYLGNRLDGDVTFNNFFDIEADGSRNFNVAPFRPIYTSAYIQDKFVFKDIIFNLGLRVDRYDANTKVLKDQFSLYDVQTAGDFYNSINEDIPTGVESDYKVYVNREGSDVVKAFRKGEQWYNESGTPVNDGNVIFGGEVVIPRYSESDPIKRNIQSREFNPDISFEDYEPVVNWMPRLAFSFPISDDANFFAHYDILVERPQSNSFVSPLSYYYFEDPSRTPQNNPGLRPAKTIDYEVGFQQKLSNSTAITLSAYYKELRDMIQARTLLYIPAPISSYETFGNIDFGTVKGFTFKYDMRRTGNIQLTANYTLQFADGTGSNANSQRGLTSRGNIRNLLPLSFDERHRFVATVDYRYGSGKKYNGPRWFGADVLANAGLNFTASAVSGRPYTRTQTPRAFGGAGFVGSINGARLPWNFTVDARADKSFRIGGKDNKRALFLNIYLRVQNVFDARNIIGVYSATGSPEDDGFLASADGQAVLNTIDQSNRDIGLYLQHYQWSLVNPGFFTLPRRAFLGAVLDF